MAAIDLTLVGLLVVVLVVLVGILARQRHMLRSAGGIAMAVARGSRWLYGIARYDDDELRWYRALGVGTRPTRILRRDTLEVLQTRSPTEAELGALPPDAKVVLCRDPSLERYGSSSQQMTIAFSDGAYTGFKSWQEASRRLPD